MPLLLVGAIAGVGGFVLGRGTEGLGDFVKWGVIGAGVYVGGKALKVF